jgi:hypothetical protein
MSGVTTERVVTAEHLGRVGRGSAPRSYTMGDLREFAKYDVPDEAVITTVEPWRTDPHRFRGLRAEHREVIWAPTESNSIIVGGSSE